MDENTPNIMPEENAPNNPQAENMQMNSGANNAGSGGAKPYSVSPNIEAVLAYFLTPITGLIILYYEKENKFVRFHAAQSIVFGVVMFVAWVIASALASVLIGFLLMPILSIAGVVLWLLLMWKAFNNEEWELPYIGKLAHNLLTKM